MTSPIIQTYRGRLAPSPTGFLHVGHATTFWHAQNRARENDCALVLRIEDLDQDRCRPEFSKAIIEDLRWFGLQWDEGPDTGGQFAPYCQSGRRAWYLDAWKKLRDRGFVYPCSCSRRDVLDSTAPHPGNEEPIYPGTCRPSRGTVFAAASPAGMNWRFRVPDDEQVNYIDQRIGMQIATAGHDFGDFLVWRKDDVPAYQLAVVVDDVAMRITEVVRGADLLTSTFRQLLLYRALRFEPPQFFHTALITDEFGQRLAKRYASLSLRELRSRGMNPESMRPCGERSFTGGAGSAG